MRSRILITVLILQLALIGCGQTQQPLTAIPDHAPAPTIHQQLAKLEGLEFGEFLDESYEILLLRDPDRITRLGLQERLGAPTDRLTDMSEDYLLETQELERGVLAMLREYDEESLPEDLRLSYDVYAWHLEDRLRLQTYALHDYNVSQFTIDDPNGLIYFFTDIHPIKDKQDAEDYVARLFEVGKRVELGREGLELREEIGVVLPGFIIDLGVHDLQRVAYAQAGRTPFFTTFEVRLRQINNLSVQEKEMLLESAREAIETIVQPAFVDLLEFLKSQRGRASDDAGAWKLPDGESYYAMTLRHHTTSDISADAIHELGLREVDRLHAEIRERGSQLGLAEDADLTLIFQTAARQGGGIPRGQVLTRYEEIIADMQDRLPDVFEHLPDTEIIVLASTSGNFYEPASMDGERAAAFYASFGSGQDYYRMPSLVYHETIPGHHLQIATAQTQALPLFRNLVEFTGFVEGWALYAERLAWEMGLYDNDPYGDLGRLQYELLRAARLVIDTGLHAKRWSFNEAVAYMVENTGFSRATAQYEVARYVVWPGQATAYYVGMLKILELRERAAAELGEAFSLKEFHTLLLQNGSIPLDILEQVVDGYITSQ